MEGDIGADQSGICVKLDGIFICVCIKDAPERDAHGGPIRDHFYVPGLAGFLRLYCRQDFGKPCGTVRLQDIIGGLYVITLYGIGVAVCDKNQIAVVAAFPYFPGCVHSVHAIHVNIKNNKLKASRSIGAEKLICTCKEMDLDFCILFPIDGEKVCFDLLKIFSDIINNCNVQGCPPL